jgi:hypothetical protein
MVCSGRAGKEASLFEVHQLQKKNLLANSNEHLIFVSRFYCKEESTMSYYTEEQIQQASIISLSSIEMRINLMWYHNDVNKS